MRACSRREYEAERGWTEREQRARSSLRDPWQCATKSATSQHSCSDLQVTVDVLALHTLPYTSGERRIKDNSLLLPLFQAKNSATEIIVSGGLNSPTQ